MLLDNLKRQGCLIIEDNGMLVEIKYPEDFSHSQLHALKLEVGEDVSLVPLEQSSAVDEHRQSIARLDTVGDKALASQEVSHSLEQNRIDIGTPSFEKQPVADLVDSFLSIALERSASDIHLLSDEEGFKVLIRVDGVLSELVRLKQELAQPVLARVKVLSGMDITERRKPQDGRMALSLNNHNYDLRIASAPVVHGERMTMRIFSRASDFSTLSDLNVPDNIQKQLLSACSSLYGLLLVCGPTGSGKTSTIYALLKELIGRGLNIVSVEDPVENVIEGISQSQVNRAVGYDFSEGIRSFLRHDPDIILVGEIRDIETAEAAMRAALTGHLVISTVHATSLDSVYSRLKTLGLNDEDLKVALTGVCNQRLVRHYCPSCVKKSKKEPGHKSLLPMTFSGCPDCYYTGFSGRIPLLEFTSKIVGDSSVESISQQALALHKKGLIPKFEAMKVSQL